MCLMQLCLNCNSVEIHAVPLLTSLLCLLAWGLMGITEEILLKFARTVRMKMKRG